MTFIEFALIGMAILAVMVILFLHFYAPFDLSGLEPPKPLPSIDPSLLNPCGNGVNCNKAKGCLDVHCPGRPS